jgi:coenzyme PQQ biosynthesis protein C
MELLVCGVPARLGGDKRVKPRTQASLAVSADGEHDAYVHFVREKSLSEAIASSLTELFSPQIISERIEGILKNYDFVTPETLAYFSQRPP